MCFFRLYSQHFLIYLSLFSAFLKFFKQLSVIFTVSHRTLHYVGVFVACVAFSFTMMAECVSFVVVSQQFLLFFLNRFSLLPAGGIFISKFCLCHCLSLYFAMFLPLSSAVFLAMAVRFSKNLVMSSDFMSLQVFVPKIPLL